MSGIFCLCEKPCPRETYILELSSSKHLCHSSHLTCFLTGELSGHPDRLLLHTDEVRIDSIILLLNPILQGEFLHVPSARMSLIFPRLMLRTAFFSWSSFGSYDIRRADFMSLLITDAPGENEVTDMPTLVGDFAVITHQV